jgi:hypothetical protein
MATTPTLAKIKLNGTEYDIKDADARSRLTTIEGSYITSADIPTNVSSFNNDSGYLTLTTLPIYDGTVE